MQEFGLALIVLGVAVGVAAVVWWFVKSARRAESFGGGIADVEVADGRLFVRPRTVWKVLALTGHLEIPMRRVVSCSVEGDPASSRPIAFRLGGTGVPGRVRAGYMVGEGGRSWWLYRFQGAAVVIELDGHRLSYLVVEVDDPQTTAREVNEALTNRQRSWE